VFILPTPPPAITQQGFTLELLVDLFIEQHSHIVAMALTHTDPHFTVRKLLLLSPGSIIQGLRFGRKHTDIFPQI